MSKTSLKPIDYSSRVTVGTCPARTERKIYENPESIKNWVDARDKELNDKIEKIYNKLHQEISDISSNISTTLNNINQRLNIQEQAQSLNEWAEY